MNDIEVKIHQILENKLGVDKAVIRDEATFDNDLAIDSLDFCEVIVDIEKAFDISIPDEAYTKLKTVGSLVQFVTRECHVAA
ncbi:MAG: acyl carrier protein [Mucilaginibacter sp.]